VRMTENNNENDDESEPASIVIAYRRNLMYSSEWKTRWTRRGQQEWPPLLRNEAIGQVLSHTRGLACFSSSLSYSCRKWNKRISYLKTATA